MNGGTCFIASPANSSTGSGGSTPTLLMAAAATQPPFFNIDMSKMSISSSASAGRLVADERSKTTQFSATHIRADSHDPKVDLDALFDLSRARQMKPMRQRKLPPSFFSYSPKPSIATSQPWTLEVVKQSSSSSMLTPQSPLAVAVPAAVNIDHQQHQPVDVSPSNVNIRQLQPPQQNSSPSPSQQQRFRNKHLRTRSSPATLEETLAVVPPELPPSHASPNSVPGAAAAVASPSSNGPLSPLSSTATRLQHRHQPLLLPPRHNMLLLHGHRPLTLAPQPNGNDEVEAMCIDTVVDAVQSPPTKRANNISRHQHINNNNSVHERQQSLPMPAQQQTAATVNRTNAEFVLKQTSVPPSPLLLLPQANVSQLASVANANHPHHFHSPSLPSMPPPSTTTPLPTNFVDNQPLPPGWEMGFAESGQKYFINHQEKTTTWDDPRLGALRSEQKSPPRSNGVFADNKANDIRHVRQMSSPILSGGTAAGSTALSLANEDDLSLPTGWEKRVNEQGQVYFVDHINKRTSWDDPRITQRAEEVLPSFQQFTAASNNAIPSTANTTPTPSEASIVAQNLRPTNLELSSSHSAISERAQVNSERPPVSSSNKPMDGLTQQQHQARMRGVLQAEREQMHIRRLERDQKWHTSGKSTNNPTTPQQQHLRTTPPAIRVVGSGMNMNAPMVVNNDPFLGNNALLNNLPNPQQAPSFIANGGGGDFHSRQASCDSGMSSAGGCSLPQTPEGLLAQTLDELNLNQQQQLHLQYNKLRSARDNNYHHHHHHYQSSLLGSCWPPPAQQPQQNLFQLHQNPTVHQKSASIDVGCLTTTTSSLPAAVVPQRQQINGNTEVSQQTVALLNTTEDANMLSMVAEQLPEDLCRIDFDDLDAILNPPSLNNNNGSNNFNLPQQQGQMAFDGSNNSSLLHVSAAASGQQHQQQHHRHQRQQAFCE